MNLLEKLQKYRFRREQNNPNIIYNNTRTLVSTRDKIFWSNWKIVVVWWWLGAAYKNTHTHTLVCVLFLKVRNKKWEMKWDGGGYVLIVGA